MLNLVSAREGASAPLAQSRPGNAQTGGVDISAVLGHHRRMPGETQKQFSLTGAALITGERAKSNFYQLFKSGVGWKIHHFMRQLKRSDQLTLARATPKAGREPPAVGYYSRDSQQIPRHASFR